MKTWRLWRDLTLDLYDSLFTLFRIHHPAARLAILVALILLASTFAPQQRPQREAEAAAVAEIYQPPETHWPMSDKQ